MTTMVMSMLMSSSADTAMVIASITPLFTSLGKKSGVSKAFLLGVPTAAIIGGMGTIIGTASNAIAVGELDEIGVKISFLDWMMFAVPVTFVLTTVSCLTLILIFLKDNTPIHPELIKSEAVDQSREMKAKRRIVISVLLTTVLLWLSGQYLGITVASVTAVPLVFLTLTGIITAKDVRSLPWDVLLLVAGGLSIGVALQQTNLLHYYSGKIMGLGLSPILMLFILAYLVMLIGNFMSASAITTVLIPIAFAILPALQKEVAIIIALSTSAGIFLPVSDIPNAIAYGTGYLKQKDFLIGGLLVGVLGPLLIILWVTFVS
jgi:sodium-dependent dicarboxylate transporter 2/3/5